jgi:hypothetical protein
MIDLINCPHLKGEHYTIERESEADLKHRRSQPPLNAGQLEAFLQNLKERSVCLQWNGRAMVLSWPEVKEWPYRDSSAWSDVERVRTNFGSIVEYFGLSRSSTVPKRSYSSQSSTHIPRS